ncbi:hypothetical protein BOTBODRAFT_374294 [Botryobasidium botryosum FD-172 SS1]|uniref:Ubiquitin-like protease family profile domain-containing protein n=1 Tax=Botryobasidium botryosum (strain FD-172 SS1) TaxID=930990 RepID=A0A067MP92_BOTB1|nr:hypothetical protein BOTBODRAFT_374294 [Botryobasidium botryosum FD-172 SS1]
MIAQKKGERHRLSRLKDLIAQALNRVDSPKESAMWLIPILQAKHWTLVELRWDLNELRHYDSKPQRETARQDAYIVEKWTRAFLEILHTWFDQPRRSWIWIGEKRNDRQENDDDCGPFVCADIRGACRFLNKFDSLTHDNVLSRKLVTSWAKM